MFSTNSKRLALIIVLPLISLGILTTFSSSKIEAQTPVVNDTISPKAKVKFKKSKLIKDIVELAGRNNVKFEELETNFIIGNKEIYSGYIIGSDEPSAIAKTATEIELYVKEERLKFFADMVAGENNLSSEERREFKPQLDAMKAALAKRDVGSILVSQATFSGKLSNLDQLSQNGDVEWVNIKDKKQLQIRQKQNKSQKDKLQSEKSFLNRFGGFFRLPRLVESLKPASLLAQTTSSTWYPNSGRSETGESANGAGERYTKQYMRWNANRFGSSQTYEHEFYLDDNDSIVYLYRGSSQYPYCIPTVTSWNTTWGNAAAPYLDTRLEEPDQGFCEQGEMGYVIGAGQANSIPSGVTHFTYIRTYGTRATSDRFSLSSQLGYQDPVGCTTTWCSFGSNKVTLVPQWSVNVPGVKDWTKP